MIIVRRNYNSMVYGYSTQEYGLFLTDTFCKKEFVRLFRKRYHLERKHLDFYFVD